VSWDHRPIAWPNFRQALAVGQDGLLTFNARILWYPEKIMVESKIARCPGSVAEKHAKNNQPFHQSDGQLEWGVCADVLCVVYYYSQTSPLWSCLSKWHCSRNLEVCSDATLNEFAETSIPEKIGNCLECVSLMNNHPYQMATIIASLRSLLMSFLQAILLTYTRECSRPANCRNFWFYPQVSYAPWGLASKVGATSGWK